jgi:hypothetical protein
VSARQRTLVGRAAAIVSVTCAAALTVSLVGNTIAIVMIVVVGTAAETIWGVIPLMRERQRLDPSERT